MEHVAPPNTKAKVSHVAEEEAQLEAETEVYFIRKCSGSGLWLELGANSPLSTRQEISLVGQPPIMDTSALLPRRAQDPRNPSGLFDPFEER